METPRYEKVALVNPPLDEGAQRCIDAGFWQPVNLLSLASHLSQTGHPGEIQIFDQAVMSPEQIIAGLRQFLPDLVGISPHMDSYARALDIAGTVKASGADVVMGGGYVTTLGTNVMLNQDSVDYVIRHDGEESLRALVAGDPVAQIRNLVYREAGEVLQTPVKFNPCATLSELDYSLVDLQPYFENYAHALHRGRFSRPITVMTQRGCRWKDRTGGCVFCSRIEPFFRSDDVHEVWRRIRALKEEYGADAIIDIADDFLGNPHWFKAFHDARPDDLGDMGIRFIYSRVNNITPRHADMLADLNTFEVFLGLESGDPRILRNVCKGNTIPQQRRAIELLAERGINVIAAFVLGLPGENKRSLKTTYAHAVDILKYPNINELVVSIMIPLPGSRAHDALLKAKPELAARYLCSDLIGVREMQRDWVENFCATDFATVEEYVRKISGLSGKVVVEFT